MVRILKIVTLSILFILFATEKGYSNMASPDIRGSNMSEGYSSRDIDIISEYISVYFVDFDKVKFTVTYNIRTDRDGKQIPFIFDTMTELYVYGDEIFKVWVDDVEVQVKNIPSSYEDPDALVWIDSLDRHLSYPKDNVPNIIGLKYFEADIPSGEHTIRVEYTARAYISFGGKITTYSVSYNLEPARYWRSFGTLDVEINTNNLKGTFSSNLSGNYSELEGVISHWHYDELPQGNFIINYIPDISGLGKIAVIIAPEGFSLLFFAILIFFNIKYLLRYRNKNRTKRFSPFVIAGGLVVPLLYCFIFMLCYPLVDLMIGDHASGWHGYTFLIFIIYPFLVIGYLPILFIIDSFRKYQLRKKDN